MMIAYDSTGTDGGAWLFICQSHMHTLLYSSVQLTECLSDSKELSGQNFEYFCPTAINVHHPATSKAPCMYNSQNRSDSSELSLRPPFICIYIYMYIIIYYYIW